jgi:hypothetical protein
VTALVAASRRPVLRGPFLGLLAAALVLVATTVPLLDDGHGTLVVQGVALLLAAALTTTADDPSGEVLAASPWTPRARVLARTTVGLVLTVPVWVTAVLLARWRFEHTPVAGLSLQAAALAALGLAIAAVVRRRGSTSPSWLAMVGLLGVLFLLYSLGSRYAVFGGQHWGPPWEASLLRWGSLLVLALAVLALAVRDPWQDHRPRAPRAAGPVRVEPRHRDRVSDLAAR